MNDERGTALIATLSLTMILLPLGAFVVMQCCTDLMIEHNVRAEVESFYVAEAGLEHALAEIPPDSTFAPLLAGPDHIAGTVDDGVFPFVEGAPGDFPCAPFHYDVRVNAANGGMVSVVSAGSGLHGANKAVSALVSRSPLPFTPAALHAGGDAGTLDLGPGYLLSGLDHRLDDDPSQPQGPATALPALSGSRPDREELLRARLTPAEAQRLVGAGGPPSIATTPSLDVQAYANRYSQHPARVRLAAVTLQPDLILGTTQSPQVSVVTGDVDISGHLDGTGVLIVQGTLQVTGSLHFAGLVIAQGFLFQSSSHVAVAGAVWQAPGDDAHLQLDGSGSVVYSSDALATIDRAFPGLLPHAALLAGWQEQL